MTRKVVLTRILRGSLGGRFPNRPGHQLHSMKVNTDLLQQPACLPIGKEYTFQRYGSILIPPGVSIPPPPPPPPEGYGSILIPPGARIPPPPPKGIFEGATQKLWALWKYFFNLLGGGVIVGVLKYAFVEMEKEKEQKKNNAHHDRILEEMSFQLKIFGQELVKLRNVVEELKELIAEVESLKDKLDTVEERLGWIVAGEISIGGIVVAIAIVVAFFIKDK